ncbi:hypothetical protein [Bradyrhizobium centrosematis]|uniref:hypothetical protein n=1 Tax=Bradyrhizobium centrosematis TaxID=1300039 RepID=UPI0038902EF3
MYLGKGRAADYERVAKNTDYVPPPKSGEPVERSLPHGVEICATGLILPKKLDVAQWEEIGAKLCTIDRAMQWAIGDWWAYGDKTYGTRKAAALAKKLPYEFGSLMNLGSVARRVTSSSRNEALSWSHHVAVAALTAEDQKELLARAAEFRWPVSKLQEVVAGRRARASEDGLGARQPHEPEQNGESGQAIGHNSEQTQGYFNWSADFLMRASKAYRLCPWNGMVDIEQLKDASEAAIQELVEEASIVAESWTKVARQLKEHQQTLLAVRNPRSARKLN